jgi:hypothetical protein
MATVRLGRYELEDYDLPKVCMRCGARAVVYRQRRFRWFPGWLIITFPLGILPYFIITEVLTKRMEVWVPCCEEHKKRPLWPTLVNVGSLATLVAVAVVLALIFNDAGATAAICGLGMLAFLVWCFAALIISTPAIRPTEITDRSITLKGVCEEFIEALEADRRGEDDGNDRDDRPRRKRRRLDDDEDDRPRARRRPAGDDEGGDSDPGQGRRRAADDAYEEGGDRR